MKTVQIELIADPLITHIQNAKGGYESLEVPIKDNGKVNAKKLNSIYQKELFPIVKELKRGDRIEVDLEKETGSDGREYWQWKAVRKLDGTTTTITKSDEGTGTSYAAVSAPSTSPAKATGRVIGSTYETPEERALKQVLIVRQSSVTSATDILKSTGEFVSTEDVLKEAEKIYRWVFDSGRLIPPALNVSAKEDSKGVGQQAEPVAEAKAKRGRPTTKKVEDMDDDIPF